MLVDCPKCGFTQPQDQYCAKCGVDMQAYQPQQRPLSSRLISNPFFHISIVFVLIFGGTLYIMKEQRRQEIERRVDYLKSGPVYAESQNSAMTMASAPMERPEAGGSAATTTDRQAETPAPAPEAINPPAETSASVASRAQEPARDPAAETAHDPALKPPAHVKATYALAPRSSIFRMVETSRSQGGRHLDFGEFQMGTIRNVASFVTGLDVVESIQKRFLAALGEQIWFVGEKTNDGDLGITTRLNLKGREGQEIHGEIEFLRTLRDQAGAVISPKGYGPAEFELQQGQGLYIIMILPRVPQYDEGRFAPSGLLRIYRMSDFKQKQSEFVMLLDFD